MGNKKVEVIPYRSFKEKINLTKQYQNNYIEVEKDFIIIYF